MQLPYTVVAKNKITAYSWQLQNFLHLHGYFRGQVQKKKAGLPKAPAACRLAFISSIDNDKYMHVSLAA